MSKLIHEEIKFDGPRFNVVRKEYERENGQKYIRDCVNPGDAVIILPINEKNEVIMEKQFREATGEVHLELPAGMIDKGENPEHAAIRELEEETGLVANKLEHLTSVYTSSGYSSEKIHIYLATDLTKGNIHLDETEEILEIENVPLEKCFEYAMENKYDCAIESLAILTYYFKIKNS